VRCESLDRGSVYANRSVLASLLPSRAQVVAEDGGWSILIPGLPVAPDEATFAEAVDETR
jgi:hypothetical protein